MKALAAARLQRQHYPPLSEVIAQQVASIGRTESGCSEKAWRRGVESTNDFPALAFAVRYALGARCAVPDGRAPAVLSLCGGSGRCKTNVARMGVMAAGGHELNGVTATASAIDAALKRKAALLVDEVSGLSPDLTARLIHGASKRPWPVIVTTTTPVADRLKGGLREALRHRLFELHIGEAPSVEVGSIIHAASRPSGSAVGPLQPLNPQESHRSATTLFESLMEGAGIDPADGFIIWGIACAHTAAHELGFGSDDLTAWAIDQHVNGGIESAVEHVARAFREDIERNRHAICYWPNKRKHKAVCAVATPYARDFGNGLLALPVDTVHGILQREGLTIAALRAWLGRELREGAKVRIFPQKPPERAFFLQLMLPGSDVLGDNHSIKAENYK